MIEASTQGSPGGWADVAVELGYVDQAHFIHDFKAVIGETPARWAASLGQSGDASSRQGQPAEV